MKLIIALLGLTSCSYPIQLQQDDQYTCAGAFLLNTNLGPKGFDEQCQEKHGHPSCAFLVIEYRVNGNLTVICKVLK